MSIFKLADNLYIAPQLSREDAAEAAGLGIQSVICNRPDGEEPQQPAFAQVQQWLAEVGINDTAHQPVVAPQINADDIARFKQLRTEKPAPVLAYCRTGTRCSLLWGFEQVQNGATVAEVMAAAQKAGVDLSAFEPRLQDAAQAATSGN
ncbi:TIGR01244 family sulfur transferase [Uruburuella testudinis]|uniref:TIGR01244 family sulfur transferase n=1 Tax=Uruburuella testudinis TaxID=1282863 RepID=A0ABY4DUW3_9NEIS|nr:TIGR01244 family sulfur transferase [Uruburuella testudinis]UOO82514.1 TIGR01244 family sulfur transferase [Uruburuella testudinis]